jgi:hypothetical protein
MNPFFYRYWWLYYFLLFILIGWFVYSLLWTPGCGLTTVFNHSENRAAQLEQELKDCQDSKKSQNSATPNVKCNNQVTSGGQGTTETIHELGLKPGNVTLKYDMQRQPDQMDVYYDNQLVASTKRLVNGYGELNFYFKAEKGKTTTCKVIVSAPEEGTVWDYNLSCPE